MIQILYSEIIGTVIHRTFWLSDMISSDTISADHVPVTSYVFYPAIITEFSVFLNKLRDVKKLQILDCELNDLESKFSL
jgi:acetolactate synthase regulatory subunit